MAKGDKKRKKSAHALSEKRKTDRRMKRKGSPGTTERDRRNGNATLAADLPQVSPAETPADDQSTTLARMSQLEADRTNLMAQVAWARGVAQEQQKALESERKRTEKLEADLEAQRVRIEQLKALSTLDRLFGRHKRI